MEDEASFPEGFVWGAATSAAQIEGGAGTDGRRESVWDTFVREPGDVFQGHSPEHACQFYHRWESDVQIMRDAGLPAFRFSLSWSRVMKSVNEVNTSGLDYYDRLVDGLLAEGIEPYLTLYHWDLPQFIQNRGGWMNREIVKWFIDYTRIVAEGLGDRVRNWVTFNEPQIFLGLGYRSGMHAPGLKLTEEEVFRCVHHVNVAHGRAAGAIREASLKARVGMAHVANVGIPMDPDNPSCVEAALKITLQPEWTSDERTFLGTCWWADPIYRGKYPEELFERYPKFHEVVKRGDMRQISSASADFHGFNYYFGRRIDADGSIVTPSPGDPRTAMGWPLHPEGLYWASRFYHEAWGLPLYVFENGLSSMDWVGLDGKVHDLMRIDFLTRYLRELRRAIHEGIDVRGWFHWSWMDNFEWAEGYKERFGLVHVDYETQRRTPKESLKWFTEVIRTNGRSIG